MNKISSARLEFLEMDALAALSSPIHALHPMAKLWTCLFYIACVVSFPKYSLSALVPMLLYPVLLFQISGIELRQCFHKLRVVLPLVCAVGLANPFFDRAVMLRIGTVGVSGGVISMLSLMLKGVLALMASFLLVATTRIDALCAALRRLHVPSVLVTLLLLTFRYVSLMLEELSVMTEAYHLRAPGQRGIHISAWGSFLGQLLLRSMDRASELYESMQLRGFRGEFYYAEAQRGSVRDLAYAAVCTALFVLVRLYDIPQLLGSLFV